MIKWRFIGIATDFSLTSLNMVCMDFSGARQREICRRTQPLPPTLAQSLQDLRRRTTQQALTADNLLNDRNFLQIHWQYIDALAAAINQMCMDCGLDKKQIDAVGLGALILDTAVAEIHERGFITAMGSAQMLANAVGIPVIGDFYQTPDDMLLAAPFALRQIISPENVCFLYAERLLPLVAIAQNGQMCTTTYSGLGVDLVEYLRRQSAVDPANVDLQRGKVLPELVAALYQLEGESRGVSTYADYALLRRRMLTYIAQNYGNYQTNMRQFASVWLSVEYFAAYMAALACDKLPAEKKITHLLLSGSAWQNADIVKYLRQILRRDVFVLPEHSEYFAALRSRLSKQLTVDVMPTDEFLPAVTYAALAYAYMAPSTDNTERRGHSGYPFGAVATDFLSRQTRKF